MANRISSPSLISGAVVLIFTAYLSFAGFSWFLGIDQSLYDAYQQFTVPSPSSSGSITLVELDEKSLRELGPWPWPRERLAEFVKMAHEAGARFIGLLLPLYEETRASGYQGVRQLREKLNAHPLSSRHAKLADWVRENLSRLESDLNEDGHLAERVRESGNVFLPLQVRFGGKRRVPSKNPLDLLASSLLGPSDLPNEVKERISASQITLPYSELTKAGAGFGHTHLAFEAGTITRAHMPFVRYHGALLPSLPLRLAAALKGQETGDIRVRDRYIHLKGARIPIEDGGVLLRFSKDRLPYKVLSFADFLKGKKTNLKGRIVLLGFGPGVGRSYATPLHSAIPEGRLAADTLDAILTGRTVARPPALRFAEAGLAFLMGVPGLIVFFHIRPWKGFFVAVGLILVGILIGFGAFTAGGLWLKPATACMGVIALYLLTSFQQAILSPKVSEEAIETNRLLGVNFQSQGLLDLAFDKFKKLPPDDESRDLLYNLGLEYEQKRMLSKAVEVYEYIQKRGGYRDVDDRLPRLRESDSASTPGSLDSSGERSVIVDANGEARSRVGRYKILEELGKGSMGLVYKAQDPKINRLLAIKTIRFSDEFEEDVVHDIKERFFTEAEIAGRLSHPSIVTIYDVGDDGDLTYMAMEFLQGKDLDKFVTKDSLLPIRRVLEVVARVAEALDFAHQTHVIHRDIKPANIMLLDKGGIKVTDFGIAKAISSSRTRTGVILGTPNYMSPEQIMGQKIDPRSDIFSLGVLFYQLLAGELPFRGKNLSNLLYQITQVRHPSIREVNPKIPKACEQIIDKALSKNPEKRFRHAGEMAKLLNMLISKIDQLRRQPAQWSPPPKA
jgi:serine/threonine-protein kinase